MIPRSIQVSRNQNVSVNSPNIKPSSFNTSFHLDKQELASQSPSKLASQTSLMRRDHPISNKKDQYVNQALLRGMEPEEDPPNGKPDPSKSSTVRLAPLSQIGEPNILVKNISRWLEAGQRPPMTISTVTRTNTLFQPGRAAYVYYHGEPYPKLIIKGSTNTTSKNRILSSQRASQPIREKPEIIKMIIEATRRTAKPDLEAVSKEDIFTNIDEYEFKPRPQLEVNHSKTKLSFTSEKVSPLIPVTELVPESLQSLMPIKSNKRKANNEDEDELAFDHGHDDDDDDDGKVTGYYQDPDDDYNIDYDDDDDTFITTAEKQNHNERRPLNQRQLQRKATQKLTIKLRQVEKIMQQPKEDLN